MLSVVVRSFAVARQPNLTLDCGRYWSGVPKGTPRYSGARWHLHSQAPQSSNDKPLGQLVSSVGETPTAALERGFLLRCNSSTTPAMVLQALIFAITGEELEPTKELPFPRSELMARRVAYLHSRLPEVIDDRIEGI